MGKNCSRKFVSGLMTPHVKLMKSARRKGIWYFSTGERQRNASFRFSDVNSGTRYKYVQQRFSQYIFCYFDKHYIFIFLFIADGLYIFMLVVLKKMKYFRKENQNGRKLLNWSRLSHHYQTNYIWTAKITHLHICIYMY